MRVVLIECTASVLDVAKAALVNAGGKLLGVFQDITQDSLWLKAEVASCEEVPEGSRIPVFEALVEEVNGEPMLRIGFERNVGSQFRLVTEVK